MSEILSLEDISALPEDEQSLIKTMRGLQVMRGKNVSQRDVEEYIRGITVTVEALVLAAAIIANESPEEFQKLAVVTRYTGGMMKEWATRSPTPEMLKQFEELSRAAAKIGKGVFPLDDETHKINQIKRES
jgi:hypothetical protein